VERSLQKTELLEGYEDIVLHAEALEKEMDKSKKHSALLQSKLDGTFAQHHNEAK
jgi:chaperonin cofactor prefoldin